MLIELGATESQLITIHLPKITVLDASTCKN